MPIKERLHWLAMHGVVRSLANWAARHGDPQARLVADPAVRADPFGFYDGLRAAGPLVRARASFLAVDYAVANELLRSDDFRVISMGSSLPAPLRWLERRTRAPRLHPLLPPSLLAVEPPEHTRYRKTVSSVFTTRRIAELRDGVQETADALLDDLATTSSADTVVDVVDRYCARLPVTIISEMLGVPESDRPKILEFGESAAPSLDFGLTWQQYLRVERGLAGFNRWLDAHLKKLRGDRGDDLMSQLIAASEDGVQLDQNELLAIAGLVLAAGFETTVNLLGNGIRLLLTHPDQLAALRNDPALWPNAVEEILRYDSPVQLTVRIARTDTSVAGTALAAGDPVVICLAAANRDPAVFPEPHSFDVRRENAGRHLAFSGGRHFCLGAALARAEGEVGLRRFFDRFPDVQPAGEASRRETRVLRGWSHLPVRLGHPAVRRLTVG